VEDLSKIYRKVLGDLGKVYTIGYTPLNDARDGAWREVRVEVVGHPELRVFTRPGYYAK
jgi:Ca-activated chloride channel family protein